MVANLKDTEARDTGIIYKSGLEQVRKLYPIDPLLAGQLSIAIQELTLTGEISFDDITIELALENLKTIVKNNQEKYDKTKETKRQSKIQEYKLDIIADLLKQGKSQSEIGKILGLNKQTISYRINNMIKTNYPELLSNNHDESNTNFLTNSTHLSKNLTNVNEESKNFFDFDSIGSKKSDESNKNFLTNEHNLSKKSDKSDKNDLTQCESSQKSQMSQMDVYVYVNDNVNNNFLTSGQKLPTLTLAEARSIVDKELVDSEHKIIKDLKTNIIYQIID